MASNDGRWPEGPPDHSHSFHDEGASATVPFDDYPFFEGYVAEDMAQDGDDLDWAPSNLEDYFPATLSDTSMPLPLV